MPMHESLPVIDVSCLRDRDDEEVVRRIRAACRDTGFFYAIGHGVSEATVAELAEASRQFFALPESTKLAIAMEKGGRAWRGYFPVGGELTSGKPDLKEGLYFGEDRSLHDARVASGWPLHGANLYPPEIPELKNAVEAFLREAESAAQNILCGIALSLGVGRDYFRETYTNKPTMLFRVFHYPPSPPGDDGWGVGEHTDYGLLTLLAQDDVGGLQVKTPRGWIDAPPVPGSLVCNIGDMLDRLTGGHYRSTPHRVRNVSGLDRYSFPFFFDPAFDAEIVALPDHGGARDDGAERWDRANVHAFNGTYGAYLLSKVAKVFPDLAKRVDATS